MDKDILIRAWKLMCTARNMTAVYEENFAFASKYVHATSRGHEAIQIAMGMQLKAQDWLSLYYRDDATLLAIGMEPYELMLQLMAKRDDPFSGGRTYYCHPALRRPEMPKIPHQSSATGMQAIPTTGVALGIKYREALNMGNGIASAGVRSSALTDALEELKEAAEGDIPTPEIPEMPPFDPKEKPVVVCSLGDASITEGEVAEAFQMAVLKQLPIIYLIQDNEWDISANARETRAQDASEYARGFKGLEVRKVAGHDFEASYKTVQDAIAWVRKERKPILIHAKVPLLNHHTSGVRKEWYRDDLDEHAQRDPWTFLRKALKKKGVKEAELDRMDAESLERVKEDFEKSKAAPDPRPEDLFTHDFAPTPVTQEQGERAPKGKDKVVMVDCALFAIRELMAEHKECLLYGQDVGRRLGGVFREAATLAEQFGDERVFNTPIQEAFIIGSTVGMSATGLKPIVEVQFADYIWPGLNQLFTEVSRSCYLTNGKWPVSMVLRVPIGAYGSGGPYHSSSVESVLTNIRGIKIAYPSNAADLKGLMKAAWLDPNPVVMLEHKGLYWSKIKGTEEAKCVEPSADYILPFGKGRIALEAEQDKINSGRSALVITYGMGVYWARNAAQALPGQIEVLDLRTLYPLDEELVLERAAAHSRVLVLTEEPPRNSFAQALAGFVQEKVFDQLDAPVMTMGSESLPAIPLNSTLEQSMLPNPAKVEQKLRELLTW